MRRDWREGRAVIRLCWNEMRKRSMEGKGGGKWKEERKKFFEDIGWRADEVEKRRDEGDIWFGELINKDREEQRLER